MCVEEAFRFRDALEVFFLIETLDPTRGKLTMELLRLTCMEGLVEGVEPFCLSARAVAPSSPPLILVNLLRFLPNEGFLRLWPTVCDLCCFGLPAWGLPEGDPFVAGCVEDALRIAEGRADGEAESEYGMMDVNVVSCFACILFPSDFQTDRLFSVETKAVKPRTSRFC